MIDALNVNIENLGDSIFGEDANFEDLKTFLNCLEDKELEELKAGVKEAFDFEE